jgi:hypothetical protein
MTLTNPDMGLHTAAIRTLNDDFRTTMRGGKVTMTCGVAALSPDEQVAVIRQVRGFSDFTPGNDQHGEHDFGAIELAGEKFFWKIDYYDKSMDAGSEDPADPAQTTRVLTIMLASEY